MTWRRTTRIVFFATISIGLVGTLAARGASPAAFDRRCIPPDYVASRSNTAGILPRRALSRGRITDLGATRDLHHGLLPVAAGQATAQLLVTVLDAHGAPVAALTREDFRLSLDGTEREVVSVEPVRPTVQVVAIFEGLAATQRQTSAAITSFIATLDSDSIVDMQSVDGPLHAAIIEAVEDLHAREASRPVIVMLGQASEIVPSEHQSSQVRGKRQAADLGGDLDQLSRLLARHGILFHGVSVTEVSLANLTALAEGTGGRFEVIPAPAGLGEALTGIGRELGTQYLVSFASGLGTGTQPLLEVTRPGLSVRTAPFGPTH